MRILLTGASSELGRRLYVRLKADPQFSKAAFLLLRHRQPVEAASGDAVLDGSLSELAGLPPLDAVIHLAARSHATHVAAYQRVNVDGTKRLLESLDQSIVKQFIYVSTRCIGEAGGAYSRSKASAERLLRESGIPWTIFRPAEILGERYGRGITQFVELARRRRIFPVIVSAAPLTVAPIALDDVVEAVARSLLNPLCLGKTYTLAGPRAYRFVEIWRLLNDSRAGGVWPLPVPALLLSAACAVSALWPIFGALAPDQMQRLRLEKSSDSSDAIRDLGFRSRSLEELLRG